MHVQELNSSERPIMFVFVILLNNYIPCSNDMLQHLSVKLFFQHRLGQLSSFFERPPQVEKCVVTQHLNPVLSLGNQDSWDSKIASWGSVVTDGPLWRLYYTAKDKHGINRICLAFSKQGLKWEKSLDSPVLDAGPKNSWDAFGVHCSIVWKEKTSWKMIYTGCNSYEEQHYQIGLAESQNGIDWTKFEGNPVFNSNHSWDMNKRQNHETEGWAERNSVGGGARTRLPLPAGAESHDSRGHRQGGFER